MLFEDIETYIQKPINERQKHVDKDDFCIEIGGDSRTARLLMCHYLNVTCPTGMKILLCHYCGNSKCSNPKHLYWGTPKENTADSKRHGTWKSFWDKTVEKHGLEEAHKIVRNNSGGKGKEPANKLKKDKIDERMSIIIKSNPLKHGWIARAQNLFKNEMNLDLSHTQIRRFTSLNNVETYKRN